MHGVKKATVLALVAALMLVLGALRPELPAERSQAAFPVGGIAALPSALPAVAPIYAVIDGVPQWLTTGVAQTLPAVAPASGPGSFAIVDAICVDMAYPYTCPVGRGGDVAPIKFTMSKVYPTGGQPVAATFTANGEQTLLCNDDASCDLTDPDVETGSFLQHVAVGLTGGGENEVIEVTACDGTGDCRSVQLAFVETMLAVPPLTGAPADAPALVSYRCDNVGLYTGEAADTVVPVPPSQVTPEVSWEEVFDWFYYHGLFSVTRGALRASADQPFYSCGGDTSSPVDDRVNFETDTGILTVDFLGDVGELIQGPPDFRPFGSVTPGCDAGDSVDILDGPGPVVETRGVTAGPIIPPGPLPATYCDLNFAPNGVVTYTLLGTGESAVATITGQQSGGGGPLRTNNVSLIGLPALSLFLETPPGSIGPEGGEFSAVVVDAKFRPIAGQTVGCTADPKDAVLAIIPQTGTSAPLPDPYVHFTLFPTRSAVETGVDVTVVCALDSNPDKKAIAVVRVGKPAESVELVAGCNPVASTWPDDSPIETVIGAVSPAEALDAVWAFDAESGAWQGYSAAAPEASDLASVNQLQAIFVCMNATGTIGRPVI